MIPDASNRTAVSEAERTLGRLRRQFDAVGRIGEAAEIVAGDVEGLARKITELAAEVISCERVNVWLFEEGQSRLRCIDHYDRTPAHHSVGAILDEVENRAEFASLKHDRFVDAHEALTDPRTAGCIETYLKPFRITSLLDAAIRVSGRNLGLLCFEHVDLPHRWDQDEISFALQLADKLGLTLANRTRRLAEEAQQASEARFRAIYASISDGIAVQDLATLEILDVNPRVCAIFGYTRDEMLKLSLVDLFVNIAPYTTDQMGDLLKRAVAGESPVFDWYCKTKEGRRFWVEVSLHRAEFGGRSVLLSATRDITVQKETQEALRVSELRYRALVETTPDWFWEMDEQFRFTYASPQCRALLGYDPDEVLGRSVFDFMTEADARRTRAETAELLEHRRAMRAYVTTFRHKSGQKVITETNANPLFDAEGCYRGYRGIDRDITERKDAEEALRKSQQLVAGILDTIPVRVFWKDKDLVYLGCNPLFATDAGYAEPKDVVGKTDYEMGWADQAELHRRDDREVIESGKPKLLIEEFRTTPAGQQALLTNKIPLRGPSGEIEGALGASMDVTDLRHAQEALRQSEAELREAQRLGKLGSWTWEPEADHVTWSEELYRMVGRDSALPPPTVRQQAELFVPQSYAEMTAALREVVARGTPYSLDLEFIRPGGETGRMLVRGEAERGPTAAVCRVRGSAIDITELRRAEERVRAVQIALEEAQAVGHVGSWQLDHLTRRLTWSDETYRLYGVEPAMFALSLEAVLARVHPDDRELLECAHKSSLEARIPYAVDHRIVWDDGTVHVVHERGQTFYGADGAPLRTTGTVQDVTERKKAEEGLAYRDRILKALTEGTAELVANESLDIGMARALKQVSETLGVDRMLVLENNSDPTLAPLLRYSWQTPAVPVRFDRGPLFPALPAAAILRTTWLSPLREGKPVVAHLSSATGEVRRILERAHNQSLLLVPIFVAGSLWGQIGVDECKAQREWTATEIEALRTFAEVIGTLIQRNATRLSLLESEERFRAVSEAAQDAIIMMNSAGRIEYWNRAAERVLGYTAAEAAGRDAHHWLAPERYRGQAEIGMKKFAASGEGDVLGKTLELAALRKDGTEVPVELSVAGMRLNNEWHAVAILRDITERKQTAERIAQLARHDFLTGLPNRMVFVEAIGQAIARASRTGSEFAVLYLDLDHFKDVNDTLGHPVGDLLLQGVAERLRAAIRETDTVARFGGDEFAIVQTDIGEPADAALLADKVLHAVGGPFLLQGNDVRTGTSIGICVYGPDSPDAETLLSHADVALYRAKLEGRGTYRFFTESMDVEVRRRVTLSAELRTAIASGQLFLVYQPQVDGRTGRIVGVEALVRWHHPQRGLVGPGEFIGVGEQMGLIVALGRWVLQQACRQMRQWMDLGIAPPLVAINLSGLQFKTPRQLEADIAAALAETGVPPRCLELELTESTLMEAAQEHNDVLVRLRQAGLRIAIDDFGTGFSSLDYLRRFPVDRIKIAQSFVTSMTPNSGDAVIVRAAIGLGHDLGLNVVVEGVETKAQLDMIRAWGGHLIQGYHFSKPLVPGDLRPLLEAGMIQAPRIVTDTV